MNYTNRKEKLNKFPKCKLRDVIFKKFRHTIQTRFFQVIIFSRQSNKCISVGKKVLVIEKKGCTT